MNIAVIQPSKIGDILSDKVIEFKCNMSQFNVTNKVHLFKQTSELTCSEFG